MSVQLRSAEGQFQPVPYHHVAVATGSRIVEIAGQIDRDHTGRAVSGGDIGGQIAQALRGAALGLAEAGGTFADVTRIRMFAAKWQPENMAALLAGIESVADEIGLAHPYPPMSLIGVDFLFEPDVLIEAEVSAVLE